MGRFVSHIYDIGIVCDIGYNIRIVVRGKVYLGLVGGNWLKVCKRNICTWGGDLDMCYIW